MIFQFGRFTSIKKLEVIPTTLYDRLDKGMLPKKLEERGQKYLSILGELIAHREYDHPSSGYHG